MRQSRWFTQLEDSAAKGTKDVMALEAALVVSAATRSR